MGKRVSKEVILKRREMVASLLARGMRQSEILTQLSTPQIKRNGKIVENPMYLPNPNTGEPWDKATISRDTDALRKDWQDNAERDTDELRSEQLARSEELFRMAIARGDISECRRVLEFQMKLLGTAKPEKQEHRWDDSQLQSMMSAKDALREKIDNLMAGGDATSESS